MGIVKDNAAANLSRPYNKTLFCKARIVSYALKGKTEKKLEHLVKQGVIEPIYFSEWAAPIVPVIKKDGSVIICEDYKTIVNQAVK